MKKYFKDLYLLTIAQINKINIFKVIITINTQYVYNFWFLK